jgi:hypothetical protein
MENNYGVGLYQDGVFYFTNPGIGKFKDKFNNESTDFTTLWNNNEYTFKEKTTVPLIIPNTTPEEIQNIRKQFAKNYATAWFFTTKRYKDLVKKGGYIPATYDEDTEYKDVIQACLTPLPKSQLEVKELPKIDERNFKGSKAIGKNTNLNEAFKDYEIPELGRM